MSARVSPAAKKNQAPVVPRKRLRMKAASTGSAAPSSTEIHSVRYTRCVA